MALIDVAGLNSANFTHKSIVVKIELRQPWIFFHNCSKLKITRTPTNTVSSPLPITQ